MYVGETSRSLYERSKEQWSTWRSRKHSRQVGEAVRIRRRGGAGSILNSKTEYDRCRIPRLVVQEEDEEEIAKKEEQEIININKELEEESRVWGRRKFEERSQEARRIARNLGGIEDKFGSKKRNTEGAGKGARTKRRKYPQYTPSPPWGGLGVYSKGAEKLVPQLAGSTNTCNGAEQLAPQPANSPTTSGTLFFFYKNQ